ncbi:MAG: hypothetical protein ACMG6H_15015 [Acidobacteriota bacterium]
MGIVQSLSEVRERKGESLREVGAAAPAILATRESQSIPCAGDARALCAAFDLLPEECLMCAAHERDLAFAARIGMRTAFIHRPDEFGPGKGGTLPLFRGSRRGVAFRSRHRPSRHFAAGTERADTISS